MLHCMAYRSEKALFRVTRSLVFCVMFCRCDWFCLYNYEFWLSLCKVVRSSVILLLPLLVFCSFSFGHCIVYPSIYGFWLPFRYLLDIVLSILRFTDSDYPFGIFKLFFHLRSFWKPISADVILKTNPVWPLEMYILKCRVGSLTPPHT